MATFYNTEVTVGNTLSSNASAPFVSTPTTCVLAGLSSASLANGTRFVFNSNSVLTTAVAFSATFANTSGLSLSSGAGLVVYNRALSGQQVAIVLSDRTSFTFTLPGSSTTVTLASNGYDNWGPNEVRLRNLGYF